MSLRIVIYCAVFLMLVSIASAQSVSIPLGTIKKPASDLITTNGQAIDPGQAAGLAERGQDLSLFNPADNKFWQNQIYSAEDLNPKAFPKFEVNYLQDEAGLPFTFMGRVQSKENPQQFFRMTLSRFTQSTLMRAALLRKLGYYLPSPKYYSQLKVHFSSAVEKERYKNDAQKNLISDFESRNWIAEETETSVVFRDVVLEVMSNDFFDIIRGYAPDPSNPAQAATVARLARHRAYRALIIPYALVDVPESINRFSPKLGSVLSGHITLAHPSAKSFGSATYEDLRWLLLRMSTWTLQDYKEVAESGYYPAELQEIVLRKLLYRTANAFELFNIPSALTKNLPELAYTSPSGLVVNGKVQKEFVPGYPQRFAHGDRESPFKDGDLQRYFGIRGTSMVIGTVLNNINEKLQFLNVGDLYQKRRETIQQRILNHIRTKPREPLYQDIEAWGGPVAGVQASAVRSVTTGTYFGSSAAIQLVDNVSVGATLGYFMGIDGAPRFNPVGGGNVQLQRDFTHVRPLLSISEGKEVPWKDLAVPFKMKSLAKILQGPTERPKDLPADEPFRHPVDQFLSELRDGEVFTITDSLSLVGYAQVSNSLDNLLGIGPSQFANSMSIGADVSRVLLRQVSFMKLNGSVQVYVRDQTSKAFGLTLDVNYFLNLLRVRASASQADLRTDAFVISYDPAISEYIDGNATEDFAVKHIKNQKDLRLALETLFISNETELLYARFKYQKFQIDHQLRNKEIRKKFLIWKMNQFQEEHTVKIQYPLSEEAPELNPADEAVTLFSSRKGQLKGVDLLGFLFDLVEGVLNDRVPQARVDLARSADPNPSNVPFGKAQWRMVNVQSDLTPGPDAYASVGILQDVWSGWNMKGDDFKNLLNVIQKDFERTPVASYRLLEPEFFYMTKAIDFYRVTAQLSILPTGLEKVKELVLQPNVQGQPPRMKGLSRVFQLLTQKLQRKARYQDLAIYESFLKIFGEGNLQLGKTLYTQTCKENNLKRTSGKGDYTGTWVDGIYYDCMDDWMKRIMELSKKYPSDKKQQNLWMNEVLDILDTHLTLPQVLKFLGPANYIYFVRINGFRSGDEDGNIEYFSNTLGDPQQSIEFGNGLIQMFANKTRISPIELERTLGGFR